MSSAGSSPNWNRETGPSEATPAWPFATGFDNEILWGPYRTAWKILLEAHHQAATMMEINRKLTEEYLEIVRREQDMMHEAVEKILHRLADGSGPPTGVGTVTTESFAEFYDSAVSSLRQLAEAVTDAQSRSIEALQLHARTVGETQRPQERKSA